MVLNRRLDAAFVEMEIAWGIYKAQRTPENFRRYLGALRRCRMLDELLKHS
jgi:hypothetical protein